MKDRLEKMHARLTNAAGDTWMAATDYYTDNAGTAVYDEEYYNELNGRLDILLNACEEIQLALRVIRIFEDADNE